MKYDLIVVGGGPAGLMAAKTAAEDGLKVLLIERKKDITSTNRSDVSIFYWKFVIPDEYIEPIMVEIGTGKSLVDIGGGKPTTRFNFLGPGFSIDYTGPIVPYYNFINLSPSGYQVYSIKNELWGFYYSREVILADLLGAVQKTKAEVLTETMALGAENISDGVKILVKTKSGEETLVARKAIAAEGVNSRIVESLGLNQNRQVLRHAKAVGYVLEGVKADADVPDHCSWLSFLIPSISEGGVLMGLHAEAENVNMRHLLAGSEETINKFIKQSRYAPWFSNARLVRKTATGAYQRVPTLREPAMGNILIVGDAISQESWIQGAIACGYQGAKATLKELSGQKGYPGYTDWLHKAFAFFVYPDHFKLKARHHVLRMVCSNDEEADTIYRLFEGKIGHPAFLMAEEPELIKDERPDLYQKLKKAIEDLDRIAVQGWG